MLIFQGRWHTTITPFRIQVRLKTTLLVYTQIRVKSYYKRLMFIDFKMECVCVCKTPNVNRESLSDSKSFKYKRDKTVLVSTHNYTPAAMTIFCGVARHQQIDSNGGTKDERGEIKRKNKSQLVSYSHRMSQLYFLSQDGRPM